MFRTDVAEVIYILIGMQNKMRFKAVGRTFVVDDGSEVEPEPEPETTFVEMDDGLLIVLSPFS